MLTMLTTMAMPKEDDLSETVPANVKYPSYTVFVKWQL